MWLNGHEPVLVSETLERLAPAPGWTVVDATVGLGGHAEALLERVGVEGRVIGIDRDPDALERARRRVARFGDRFVPLHGDHRELDSLLDAVGLGQVDAVLFDLGVSSLQLDTPERGFSFRFDGPLDMRMDPGSGPTAADLLATWDEDRLRQVLRRYGEERQAGPIARALVRRRLARPIERTLDLAEVVERAAGPGARRFRIHPATRTFQALRIAVNHELDALGSAIEQGVARLRGGGRLAVISFHSLEDRIVKHTLRELVQRCVCPPGLPVCGCGRSPVLRLIGAKPVTPDSREVSRNPRARSARLRAAEKI
jgi:16S rRNA (cytosine1402-N4)-methyltransferase